jgi:hypothetical protein
VRAITAALHLWCQFESQFKVKRGVARHSNKFATD